MKKAVVQKNGRRLFTKCIGDESILANSTATSSSITISNGTYAYDASDVLDDYLSQDDMEQINNEIERSRMECIEKSKQMQNKLKTLRSEIELLKIEQHAKLEWNLIAFDQCTNDSYFSYQLVLKILNTSQVYFNRPNN